MSLARRGWCVNIIDRHPKLAAAASGNPAAVIFSKLSAFDGLSYRFFQQAYLYAVLHFPQLLKDADCWSACGMLQLAYNDRTRRRQQELDAANLWPDEWLQSLTAAEASELAGLPLNKGGLFFPQAGWVDPRALCEHLLARHPQINLITTAEVVKIERQAAENQWLTFDSEGKIISHSDVLVLAAAHDVKHFTEAAFLPLKSIRGQVSTVTCTERSKKLRTVLCHEGYIVPAISGLHCLGATYDLDEHSVESREQDNQFNLETLAAVEPAVYATLEQNKSVKVVSDKVGFRCNTPDYLPVVGPVPDSEFFKNAYAGLTKGQLKMLLS